MYSLGICSVNLKIPSSHTPDVTNRTPSHV